MDASGPVPDCATACATAGEPSVGCTRARVSAGGVYTCAITADEHVACWGTNFRGATGASETGPLPSIVEGVEAAVAISAGYIFSCAGTRAGELWCWGDNSLGELAVGTPPDYPTQSPAPLLSPVGVVIRDLALGHSHGCLADDGGAARCWGSDEGSLHAYEDRDILLCPEWGACINYGEVGVWPPSPTPIAVPNVSSVVSVAVGEYHSCALRAAGEVLCWGFDHWGQLGLDLGHEFVPPGSPIGLPAIRGIAAAHVATCAVDWEGGVWCWGAGGPFTDESTSIPPTPEVHPVPEQLPLSVRAQSVALGNTYGCVLDQDARVWCLGPGKPSPPGEGATRVTGLPPMAQLDGGPAHICGTSCDGEVYCWGTRNEEGQLGAAEVPSNDGFLGPVHVRLPSAE